MGGIQIPDLTGYVVIVTGGNSGIGYEITLQLAAHGARVYIAARSESRIAEAMDKMRKGTSTALDLQLLSIDLQSLQSISEAARAFLDKEKRLDILVNNAGIMAVPFAHTGDGFERHWQTNYLAPFYFVQLLLPILRSTAAQDPSKSRVRIVNVSADAATMVSPKDGLNLSSPDLADVKGTMAAWRRYAHSKRAQIVHARALQDRLRATDSISAFAVHPGISSTNLQSADPTLFGTFIRYAVRLRIIPGTVPPAEAARTTVWCATSERAASECGGMYVSPGEKVDRKVERWTADKELVERLWTESERMLKEKGF